MILPPEIRYWLEHKPDAPEVFIMMPRELRAAVEQLESELTEVRCCCNGNILLGWMRFKLDGLRKRVYVMATPTYPYSVADEKLHSFEVAELLRANRIRYHALKSDHMTIEQLKQFPSFIPNE